MFEKLLGFEIWYFGYNFFELFYEIWTMVELFEKKLNQYFCLENSRNVLKKKKKVNNFNQTCSLYIEIDGKSLAKRNNVEYII